MKKKLMVLLTVIAFALSLTPLIAANPAVYAYTNAEVAAMEPVAPNTLNPITQIGTNVLSDPNFYDNGVIPRTDYGGPWSFTHNDEIAAASKPNASEFEIVSVDDAVAGMGVTSGLGALVNKGLKITARGVGNTNSAASMNSLTYSQLDDQMYGDRRLEPWYFSAWVKSTVDIWVDPGISYGAKSGTPEVFFDL
jgi:hypothetical protein